MAAALDALAATDGEICRQIGRLVQRGFLVVDKPAARVRIVTDSTADLPADVARAAGITLIPLRVHFGEQVFRDRVDLQPGQFYDLLTQGKNHPSSSPPTTEDFAALYRQLLPQSDLVSVHISSLLSLTAKNAGDGRPGGAAGRRRPPARGGRQPPGRPRPGPAGPLRQPAGRPRRKRSGDRRPAARARAAACSCFSGSTPSSTWSKAAGSAAPKDSSARCSASGRSSASRTAPSCRSTGYAAPAPCPARLLELLAAKVDPKQPILAGILHAAAPAAADRLRHQLVEEFRCAEVLIGEMGPVVGTHSGPGAIGIAALQPKPEELALLAPLG